MKFIVIVGSGCGCGCGCGPLTSQKEACSGMTSETQRRSQSQMCPSLLGFPRAMKSPSGGKKKKQECFLISSQFVHCCSSFSQDE